MGGGQQTRRCDRGRTGHPEPGVQGSGLKEEAHDLRASQRQHTAKRWAVRWEAAEAAARAGAQHVPNLHERDDRQSENQPQDVVPVTPQHGL